MVFGDVRQAGISMPLAYVCIGAEDGEVLHTIPLIPPQMIKFKDCPTFYSGQLVIDKKKFEKSINSKAGRKVFEELFNQSKR